jgi:hypothetical protein
MNGEAPKYPFADEFNQNGPVTSVPRSRGRPKKILVEPIPINPSKLPFETRGRKRRTTEIDLASKTYLQVVGAPVLPIEDFYPGCVCSVGQILPEEVDIELVVSAARVGMYNRQIAALVDMTEDSLVLHFRKTIGKVKASRGLDMLNIVNEKADEGDLPAITMILNRQDPAPKEGPQTVFIAPVPQHIMEMPAAELTAQLKLLKNNKD